MYFISIGSVYSVYLLVKQCLLFWMNVFSVTHLIFQWK